MPEKPTEVGSEDQKKWEDVEATGDVILLDLFCRQLVLKESKLDEIKAKYPEEWDQAGDTRSLLHKYKSLVRVRMDMKGALLQRNKKLLLDLKNEESFILQVFLRAGQQWLDFLKKHKDEIFRD